MPLVANNLFLFTITIGYSVGSIQQYVFRTNLPWD